MLFLESVARNLLLLFLSAKADVSLRSVENHPLSHACTVAGSLGVIWTS